MSTHTPGPWTSRDRHVVAGKRDRMEICYAAGCAGAGVAEDGTIESFRITDNEARANARLIAAAPDLLEAIQLLQGFDFKLDDSPHGHEIRRRALAAIAKAEGRS